MLNIRSTQCLSSFTAGALLLGTLLGLSGCNKMPTRPTIKTYPVTGKVVAPPGRLPQGSNIVFEPADANKIAQAIIADDGSFSLSTVFYETKLPGAVEGEHRVTINLAITADGAEGGGTSIDLPKPYKVEPKDNHFTIKIE